jgi:magnesium transporter
MSNEKALELRKENLAGFREALAHADRKSLESYYDVLQPIDIAMDMEDYDDDELEKACSFFKNEMLAHVFEQADEDLQIKLMDYMDNYRVLYLFNYMQKDNIVDILGNSSIDRRKQLLNLMKEGDKKVIQELLGYSQDSAGGIMTTEYIAISNTFTVRQALQKIKQIAPKTEIIETIFVLDEKRQLVGSVSLRDILVADDSDALMNLVDEKVISVEPETDQEEVSLLVAKYDLKIIPVVNKRRAILGVITVDDIIDVIVEEHTEDMLQMAGVSKQENISTSIPESIRMRLPWLLVNLATAFLAAFTIRGFESTIEQVVALSITMSIVAGMGGNAGTQTLSIMVRSIAMGEVKLRSCYKLVLKEFVLGVVNGLVTGLVTGVIVYFIFGNIYLGVIICIAMIGNLVIAGCFGCLIPLILKKCHADPALASSIFLTTATDVFGFFLFLGLAKAFLPFLV